MSNPSNAAHLKNKYNLPPEACHPYSIQMLEAWLQQNPRQVELWHQRGQLVEHLVRQSDKMQDHVAEMVSKGHDLSNAEHIAAEMHLHPPAP